jgi:hypothetical protein
MKNATDHDFQFPKIPYAVQVCCSLLLVASRSSIHLQNEFMRELYECLNEKKMGLFESPTGTVCTFARMISFSFVGQIVEYSLQCDAMVA